MNRTEALALVREYVKNENLVRHMLAVEAAMRWYATKYDQDVETWGLAGLLHDFDWEIHPNLEQHPQAGAPILRAKSGSRGNRARHPQPCRSHWRATPDHDGKSTVRMR